MNDHKMVDIYYWSKMDEDENLAGGDIRAKYMIPELLKQSAIGGFVFTPDSILRKEFIIKHKSLSKVLISVIFPIKLFTIAKLEKRRIRFIYCTTCYVWDTLPALTIKFFTDAKVICVSHDTPLQLEGYSFFRKNERYSILRSLIFAAIGKLQVFLLQFINIPIAISKFAMGFFQNLNVKNKVILSSNGISKIAEITGNSPKHYDLVFLGRVIPRKNLQNLLLALSNHSYKRKIKLLIITNTEERFVQESILQFLDPSLTNLTIRYSVNEEEKFKLLNFSKIYVSLSSDENFSVATIEAASMGNALLLSDHDFYRTIYGDSAVYVNENDLEEIWFNIVSLLEDEQRLKKFQNSSLNIARKYLYSDVAKREMDNITSSLKQGVES